MQNILIGLAAGLFIALVVFIWQLSKRKKTERDCKAENDNLRKMLNDRMDLEATGVSSLKSENEELKKANENLRITNAALMQKPGKAEIQRLHVYQKAVDRLTINSPGFGPAWQSALQESEEEFAKIYNGTKAFWNKIIPQGTTAKMIEDLEQDSEGSDKN